MKLLCVRGVKPGDVAILIDGSTLKSIPEWEIYEGEVYSVLSREIGHLGKPVYRLVERPFHCRYMADRFIPLSDIDETQMERNYQTEKV